uniref:Putative secreted protein n=1 Tax=Anopheles triannulatus TaxID=58253 RepID=A0A2M4B228_9DIPT
MISEAALLLGAPLAQAVYAARVHSVICYRVGMLLFPWEPGRRTTLFVVVVNMIARFVRSRLDDVQELGRRLLGRKNGGRFAKPLKILPYAGRVRLALYLDRHLRVDRPG